MSGSNTNNRPEIYTVPEVAEILRFDSSASVYDLIHTGKLKAARINKRVYRVTRDQLEDFLKEHEVKVPQF